MNTAVETLEGAIDDDGVVWHELGDEAEPFPICKTNEYGDGVTMGGPHRFFYQGVNGDAGVYGVAVAECAEDVRRYFENIRYILGPDDVAKIPEGFKS